MGIRYYAYPVAASEVEAALANPEAFVGSDPLSDAWGLEPIGPNEYAMGVNPRPRMLYLDKCWRLMQRLTRQDFEPRPAHKLVEGDVTPTHMGWYPHFAALTPAEVALVAHDLDDIAHGRLDEFCAELDEDDVDYLKSHFAEARSFTRALATSGEGLAYTIG